MFMFRCYVLRLVTAFAVAVATPLYVGTADAQSSVPPVVFAAASLKTALDAIATDWRKDTGKAATISYASSSSLARQVERGAWRRRERLAPDARIDRHCPWCADIV